MNWSSQSRSWLLRRMAPCLAAEKSPPIGITENTRKAGTSDRTHGERKLRTPAVKLIVIPIDGQPLPSPAEIIGVAADSRYRSVLDAPPLLLYSPEFQVYDSIARLMVAVNGDPRQFTSTLRRAIQEAPCEPPI